MRLVTVTLGNSYSKVEGLTTDEFRKLRKFLSYDLDPQAAYFSGGWKRTKSLLDKKGEFPTGLLKKVKDHLTAASIKYDLLDARIKPNKPYRGLVSAPTMPEPHSWQTTAVQIALNAGRGGIVAPTGTGKSLVIALIASKLKVKTLCVVPTVEIREQLREALETFNVRNVVVENIDSVALKENGDFDCLIIDEVHHAASKTYQVLNKKYWTGIYYRFFLTATFFRNQGNEQLLFEGIAGEVIYKLSYKKAVKEGYIVPVEAYYVDLPKRETEAYTWQEVYKELVVDNKVRNEIIVKIIKAFPNCLCLVKEISHGNTLSKAANVPFVNGQDEDSRKFIRQFNSGVIDTLIGTTGILGEGVDSKPAEYIVIAGLGKAKSAFQQQIGRGVRVYPGKESCKVVLFRDTSNKFLLRHYKEQCKILLEEYDVVPIKLEVA